MHPFPSYHHLPPSPSPLPFLLLPFPSFAIIVAAAAVALASANRSLATTAGSSLAASAVCAFACARLLRNGSPAFVVVVVVVAAAEAVALRRPAPSLGLNSRDGAQATPAAASGSSLAASARFAGALVFLHRAHVSSPFLYCCCCCCCCCCNNTAPCTVPGIEFREWHKHTSGPDSSLAASSGFLALVSCAIAHPLLLLLLLQHSCNECCPWG